MQDETEYLSVKDVERLVLAAHYCAHPERNSCMIQMCFLHGCRINEITALTLRDVDLPGKRIYIRRARHGISGYHPLQPKEIISYSAGCWPESVIQPIMIYSLSLRGEIR